MGLRHVHEFTRRIQLAAPSGYSVVVNEPIRPQDEDWRTVQLVKRKDALAVAELRVQTMPGCCGIAVLSYFRMWGKTKNNDAIRLIDAAVIGAKRAKYGMAMLTLLADSELIPLLEVLGWASGQPFRNGKTDNMVVVLVHDLGQPARERVRNNTGGE